MDRSLRFEGAQELVQLALRNVDQMALFRIGARFDIAHQFRERGDSLLLQPVMLRRQVAVDLGMARDMPAIGPEHIGREQVLRIASRAGPWRS